jgi:hypothetical protein
MFQYKHGPDQGDTMLGTVSTTVGHPAVAALLGLAACALAALVVAMAWNVHARQIRLAELLARRQISAPAEETAAAEAAAPESVNGGGPGHAAVPEARGASRTRPPQLIIDGPDTVVAGEQVRYTVRPSGNGKVVTWAAGGGSVSQSPDPAHPDQLLLVADRPGHLTITARVREGLTERRETKSVTAVPDETDAPSPAVPRLFMQGWGLVVVAVVIVGFAGALDALGNLATSDFIALVAPLAALLAVLALAVARTDGAPASRPDREKGSAWPRPWHR